MMLLLLSMPAFAQDYASWDEPTWLSHVDEADAALQVQVNAFDAWLTQVGTLQQQVSTKSDNGTVGQAEAQACMDGLTTVDALYTGFVGWAETYSPSLQWTQNNTAAVSEEVLDSATTTLLTYLVVAPQLTESELFLANSCMLAGVASGDNTMAADYARYGMEAAETAVELDVNVDNTIGSALMIASTVGMSEHDAWTTFGNNHCQSDECREVVREYGAGGSGGSSSGGGLSTTLATGWRMPADLHQLGVGLGVRYNNVRLEGDFLYGLQEKSRGWGVKAGLNKRFGGAWGGELGVLAVLDQYGVNDTTPTYALDRTWGLEVPLSLHLSMGSNAALFGSIAPRWNQEDTRRSTELPDWMHELHGQAGVRYYADLATLEASWFWWQTGAGKLTGPRVSLLF